MTGHTYTFIGKVLPERTYVTIGGGEPLSIQYRNPHWGIDREVLVSIGVAQISAVVTLQTEIGDIATLKNLISELASAEVDAYGYLEGRGYQIEITSVVMPNGEQTVFSVEIPELQQAKSDRPLRFESLHSEVVLGKAGEPADHAYHRRSLRYAQADLRQAILSPNDTVFHCYRAVESIMQGFKEPQGEGDGDKAWPRMREALRVEEQSLKQLAAAAARHRHGSYTAVTGGERVSAMKLAWRTVDSLVIFIHGGFKQLPGS